MNPFDLWCCLSFIFMYKYFKIVYCSIVGLYYQEYFDYAMKCLDEEHSYYREHKLEKLLSFALWFMIGGFCFALSLTTKN